MYCAAIAASQQRCAAYTAVTTALLQHVHIAATISSYKLVQTSVVWSCMHVLAYKRTGEANTLYSVSYGDAACCGSLS
jgi:hypothetical protein